MRARRHQRSGELPVHNFYRLAHLSESALARKQPRFAAPSPWLVPLPSRFSGLPRVQIASEESDGSTRPRSRPREEDGEAAPLPFARLGGHATSVSVRDASYDRQAQAGAASILVCLSVRVEDARQGIGGDAHAGVLDLELELRARVDDPHDDAPAAWGKADRIGAEVEHELGDRVLVAQGR